MTTGNPALASSLVARPGVRQLVKFVIVGASSTIIDFTLLNLLHLKAGFPLAVAATFSFLVAVSNGFYWNRKWTFRASSGNAKKQGPLFLATNVVGWLLNLTIMTLALITASAMHLTTVHESAGEIVKLIALGQGKEAFSPLAVNAAKGCATIIVTAWNFSASKFITFKS